MKYYFHWAKTRGCGEEDRMKLTLEKGLDLLSIVQREDRYAIICREVETYNLSGFYQL